MNKQNKMKQGFTLIELLVVIAIIGVLSTLSIVALNSARAKSRDAVRISSVKQMMTALELFYNDTGKYPTNQTGSVPLITAGTKLATGTPEVVYMGAIPANPTPIDNTGTCNAGNSNFVYTNASPGTYTIAYCLGGLTGSIPAGAHSAWPGGMQ